MSFHPNYNEMGSDQAGFFYIFFLIPGSFNHMAVPQVICTTSFGLFDFKFERNRRYSVTGD